MTNKFALWSLILGVVALPAAFFPLIGLVVIIIAMVLALKALKQIPKTGESGKGLAISSIVLCVIAVVVQLLIIPLAAIAYFGVLSPEKFVPERCSGPAGLDCIDRASITSSSVSFVARNNLGHSIDITDVSASGDCMLQSAVVNEAPLPTSVANGENIIVAAQCAGLSDRVKTTLTLNYVNSETGLSHSALFDISGSAR